jgi:transcriptional regulator with XRE-family HTH domain
MRNVMENRIMTVAEAIGANVKRLRESEGMRQADLAKTLRDTGLLWTRDIVASVERGRRSLSIDELLLLCRVLDVEMSEFFAGDHLIRVGDWDDETTRILELDLKGIRLRLRGGQELETARRAAREAREERDRVWAERAADPERMDALRRTWRIKMAGSTHVAQSRYGLEKESVDRAATKLWGRTWGEEHQERLIANVPDDASPRSVDAIAGHVTRQMMAEAAPVLAKRSTAKRVKA